MQGIYYKLNEIENSDLQAALCVITQTSGSTPRKAGSKMIVYDNSSIFGTIGGGNLESLVIENALKVIQSQSSVVSKHLLDKELQMGCGGSVEVYIEPVENKKKIYIFGAGHIGRNVAELAFRLNFRVILIDERENIFSEFDTTNYQIINKNFRDVFNELLFDKNTYITALSHTHGYDKEIVGYCAKKDFAYLGMIGSERKVEKLKKAYLEEKILDERDFEKIDWPMGVKISCQTPEEIAISIIAKIIDVRGKNS
jgi:xanthine dehydrogenase accessory factor